MGHRINHNVEPDADRVPRVFFGITLQIHKLPRIAQICVVRNHDHEPAFIIRNSVNARFPVIRLLPRSAANAALVLIGSLDDLIDIEKCMEDLMIHRQLLNRVLGKDFLEFRFEILLLS